MASREDSSQGHSGTKTVKRILHSVNQLLYPEPEFTAPQAEPDRREPDYVYEEVVKADVVDMKKLRALAFKGIPNQLRGIYWKLLLGYLPPERVEWAQQLLNRRNGYKTLLDSVLAEPKDSAETDHPLSNASDSAWHNHFKDLEMQEMIQRDVLRTMPELDFFCKNKVNTVHGTALNNMLFVYAKSNKRIGYVQGMNEVLAQIYYVFATSEDESERKFAEEDAFSCFAMLMGEISDTFNKELDSSMLDSFNTIGRFQALLAILDPQLYLDMKAKGLDPRFYALRWLSLLFSQEFAVAKVQRLWDSLFADDNRFDFLLFFACGLVINVRKEIIKGDFSKGLLVLQNYDVPVIEQAIKRAEQLMNHTEPFKLEPSYMKDYMDKLVSGSMTGSDMLAREDDSLKLEIKKQQVKAAASRKKAAAAAAAAAAGGSSSETTAATESKATPLPTASTEAAPVTRERKPSLPGALENFYSMPWHD